MALLSFSWVRSPSDMLKQKDVFKIDVPDFERHMWSVFCYSYNVASVYLKENWERNEKSMSF